MESPTRRYRCINKCNVFETLGVPTFCPYCGSREVYPTDEGAELYETSDEIYFDNEQS